jgi:hypothetical protein
MSQNTSKERPKEVARLLAFMLVLVILHFLYAFVVPVVFIYGQKPLLSEYVFDIWICQPILLGICLLVTRSASRVCGILVYIDVGVSVLQKANILVLYAFVDKIG